MKKFRHILMAAMSFFIACGMLVSSPVAADKPEYTGAYVEWFEGYNWFLFGANGLVAFVGVDIHEACTGGDPVDLWSAKRVQVPSDYEMIMSLWKGDDVATFIYPEAALAFTPEGDIDVGYLCGYHFDFGPVATGTSDALAHDNDVFAWRNSHRRANSFGLNATGMLYTQAGDRVAFSGGFHCVWKPVSDR